MTNLLAIITVTIITNVSESYTDYESKRIPCPDGIEGCGVFHSNLVNPKGKIVTTTIEEQTTATFVWRGKEWTVVDKNVLSSNMQKFKKDLVWTQVTNWIPDVYYYSTNSGNWGTELNGKMTNFIVKTNYLTPEAYFFLENYRNRSLCKTN